MLAALGIQDQAYSKEGTNTRPTPLHKDWSRVLENGERTWMHSVEDQLEGLAKDVERVDSLRRGGDLVDLPDDLLARRRNCLCSLLMK